jgi:hypothetical protein
MRIRSTLLLAVALLLWHANDTTACSCGTPPSPTVSLQHSAAVFTGKVISVEPQSAWPKDAVVVTVEVDRIWKGPASATIVVETASDGGACGYTFTIGEQYLIYCGRSWFSDWKNPAGLGTSICSRTRPLHAAGADLKELGVGRTVAEHRRIVSRMSTTDGVYTSRSSIPLGLDYKGGLDGWKGHISFDAETGTIEISGDMFLRVSDRLGRDVEPKSKLIRIEDQPTPTGAFSTLIDLTRVYDLDRRRLKTDGREGKAIFTVTWGCRGVAEQSSHIVVIPSIGPHTR